MDNATRRQILERVKQLGYPNTLEALRNPQVLDQYEQQLQAQSQQQQQQSIQQPQPVTFPTPPATTPNYKVPQPRQSEAKPLVMSFNETAPQLMKNGGPKDPPKKRVITDPEEFKIANQAYQDSLSTYNSTQNFINEINNVNKLYKIGVINDYDFSSDSLDSKWRPLTKLSQLQANNLKTRKSNPLYNTKGEIVGNSPVSTLPKRTDKIKGSSQIDLQAGPQPYLVTIYDAPKTKPVLEEAPLYIEPKPLTKLPIISQQSLIPYELPKILSNKSTPIYQASQAHRTGQYQIGNNVWNEDKKKWERKLFKDSEERDWYYNQGKIKKYGGKKFDKGGPKDKGWREYKTPAGESLYLDPRFKDQRYYVNEKGDHITPNQNMSLFDVQDNIWESGTSMAPLEVSPRYIYKQVPGALGAMETIRYDLDNGTNQIITPNVMATNREQQSFVNSFNPAGLLTEGVGNIAQGNIGEGLIQTGLSIPIVGQTIGKTVSAPLKFAGKEVVSTYGPALSEAGRYLTTETPLRNAYKLIPGTLKENPEMYLYRARPIGQDLNMNMAAQIRAKEVAGEPLTWYQKKFIKSSN